MTIKQKVLLVDSDKTFCEQLSAVLSEQGYEVLCATTGEEATHMVASHCPEVILLEWELPDKDGIHVLKSVREWSLCPILMLTKRAEEEDVETALDSGADDYMIKPVRPRELLARIRAAIRHTRTGSGDLMFSNEGKIILGRLTIDYNRYCVLVGTQDAGLTQNEFRLLGLLARYAGKVLTYEQIMQELWGPNAGNDNQILRVNMTNIRRKIEDDALHPKYLFTENGIGYRMATKEEVAQWE